MPWRPEYDDEVPSLGWEILDWLADHLPSPRDPDSPLILTDEQARLLIDWYSLDPSGRFVYRRAQSRRSKGWGKSPLVAGDAIAQLAGPVRFDGWDADGRPVGRPWGTGSDPEAWVQVAAVSEDQTENTHSVIHWLLTVNDGRAADELSIDPGLTRSYLRDGNRKGKLEPVTAAAGTREGQPVTYAVLDETHLWTPRNGGKKLAATIRRNAGKMDGRTFETTNSFVPGEQTVAEGTHKAGEHGSPGVLIDAVEAPAVTPESSDDEMRAALAVAYGDAWWVDLNRLVAEVRDPDTDWDDSCRFFFNWNRAHSSGFVDIVKWEQELARERVVEPGERIGVGFDGSISNDQTTLYGCTGDGFVFELRTWGRPDDAPKGWRVPRLEVDAEVERVFDTYDVGLFLGDPPKWWTELESWAERHGEDVVLQLDTNQHKYRFAPACGRFDTAVSEGAVTHDGGVGLTGDLAACARKYVQASADDEDGRSRFVIVKADTRKIDRAVAAVLAYEAAMTMPEKPVSAEPFLLRV